MYIGFIQVFDAQYIIAGFIPAASIVALYAFRRVRQGYTLRHYYRDLSPLFFVAFATLHAFDLLVREIYNITTGQLTPGFFGYVERLNPSLDNFIWYVICMALTLSVLQWPWADPPVPSFSQGIAKRIFSRINYYFKRSIKVAVYVPPFIFLLLAVREYVYGVFPNMPQEIGGGQPRCALLHIQKGKIAETTAQAPSENHAVMPQKISNYDAVWPIAEGRPNRGLADTDNVVQTKEVRVVYHSDKSLVFQILNEDHKVASYQGIFEVRRDAISAVIWLRTCSGIK
jgi:hypothetical protein